ncbi:MAG TPA: cytochrome c biogenesis protein CcsA [Candidatus Binatia bacterium]|nr:cytochrome c biogenesis protein CcsA [Candidatus Binatia bacterium]
MTTLISALLVGSLVLLLSTAAIGVGAMLLGVAARAPWPALGGGGGLAELPSGRGRLPLLPLVGVGAGFALLLLSVLLRAILVGHAPWSNLHEFSIAFAAALLGAYLLLARANPIAGLAPLAALLAAGILGFALSLDDRVDPLVPALQQPLLLTVHVGSAALAYAVAGVAFLAAAAEIAQRASADGIRSLPSAATARAVGHRSVLVAFPILTIAIALGSVWANLAWRSYWSNDPKELAAAATWLVFGAYLHVAGRHDRWERLAPWLIVLGFAGVLFTYIGAGLLFVGEHSYATP